MHTLPYLGIVEGSRGKGSSAEGEGSSAVAADACAAAGQLTPRGLQPNISPHMLVIMPICAIWFIIYKSEYVCVKHDHIF